MATYTKFYCFLENSFEKVHNLASDQLTVALTNTAPSQSNTVIADITQISYTNLSSRDITVSSSSQTTGTYSLVTTDLTLTATGAVPTFRYAVIYNSTAAGGPLIGYYDYSSSISTMTTGETFLIDFGTSLFTAA